MLPDVPGTWNRAAYKDKLSALKKYMHLTPNSDAIPDCALHNRSGIMRQEGQAGCGEIVFKSVHCTSLVFVTFGWLFIAGSLYKAPLHCEAEYRQTFQSFVRLRLCHLPRSGKRFAAGSGTYKMWLLTLHLRILGANTVCGRVLVTVLWAPALYLIT